jgi:hypothetical protein
LTPSWTPNEEYYQNIVKAEEAVSLGQPVSIIARGLVADTGTAVYVDRIMDIVVGIDMKCE